MSMGDRECTKESFTTIWGCFSITLLNKKGNGIRLYIYVDFERIFCIILARIETASSGLYLWTSTESGLDFRSWILWIGGNCWGLKWEVLSNWWVDVGPRIQKWICQETGICFSAILSVGNKEVGFPKDWFRCWGANFFILTSACKAEVRLGLIEAISSSSAGLMLVATKLVKFMKLK